MKPIERDVFHFLGSHGHFQVYSKIERTTAASFLQDLAECLFPSFFSFVTPGSLLSDRPSMADCRAPASHAWKASLQGSSVYTAETPRLFQANATLAAEEAKV